jgi:hypothetical protein
LIKLYNNTVVHGSYGDMTATIDSRIYKWIKLNRSDTLSSPSPSRTPPAPAAKLTQLDPDSELSEMTDDEQDASDAVDKQAPSSVKERGDNAHPIPKI